MPATLHDARERRPTPPLVEVELTLTQMLDDPIVVRVMQRDGVDPAQVLQLFVKRQRDWLCRAA